MISTRIDGAEQNKYNMSKLREYIESNAIRRLTEEQQDELALMVDAGDDERLEEWCRLNEVSMDRVKRWARTGALAASMAIGATDPMLAEDDIPAWIRNQANQTTFAQTAQQRMQQGINPRRVDPNDRIHQRPERQYGSNHWNSRPGMAWDPVRNIWVPRPGMYVTMGTQYDPYYAARQMHNRMQGGYEYASDDGEDYQEQDYSMPQTGGPGVVPPDPPPPPGTQVDIDSSPEGDPGEPANAPIEDVPSKTVMYDFGGQQVAFKPFATPIEIARARQMGAFNTQVRLKGQPNPSNALVYEQNGIKYVLLLPRN